MDSRTDVFSGCDDASNAVAKFAALIGNDMRWAFLLERKGQIRMRQGLLGWIGWPKKPV
jgi:hypothetical protein